MTRFSLRDVFWLTLVVGMGVGWWRDRSANAFYHAYYKNEAMVLRAQLKESLEWQNAAQQALPKGWALKLTGYKGLTPIVKLKRPEGSLPGDETGDPVEQP